MLTNTCGRRCSPARYGRACRAMRTVRDGRRSRYECCSFICSSTQAVCKGTDLLLFRCSSINDACKRSWPVIQFSSVRPIMLRHEGGEGPSKATQVVFVHPRRSFMKSLASRCSGVSVSSTQVSGDMLWLHAVACAKPRGGRPRSDRQQDTDGWVFAGYSWVGYTQQDGIGLPKAWLKDRGQHTWNRVSCTGGGRTKAECSTRKINSSTQVSVPTVRVHTSDHAT